MFRYLTAGESHGKGLTLIIDGLPAGVSIDLERINRELARRRPNPTRRDLRDHLRALLEGDTPAPVKTEAVGCLLPDPPLDATRPR